MPEITQTRETYPFSKLFDLFTPYAYITMAFIYLLLCWIALALNGGPCYSGLSTFGLVWIDCFVNSTPVLAPLLPLSSTPSSLTTEVFDHQGTVPNQTQRHGFKRSRGKVETFHIIVHCTQAEVSRAQQSTPTLIRPGNTNHLIKSITPYHPRASRPPTSSETHPSSYAIPPTTPQSLAASV